MARFDYVPGRLAVAYYSPNRQLLGSIDQSSHQLDVAQWLTGSAEASNITDLDMGVDSEFADATTRATAATGFASQIPILKNCQVTFEMRWLPLENTITDPTAAPSDFTGQLMWAWQNDDSIPMVFLDWGWNVTPTQGRTIAPQGLSSNWSVSMSISQGLRDVQRASVTLSGASRSWWFTGAQVGS